MQLNTKDMKERDVQTMDVYDVSDDGIYKDDNDDDDNDDLMPRLQSSMRIVRKPSSRAWNAVEAEN